MKLVYGVVDIPYVAQLSPTEKRNLRWRLKKKPWQSLAHTQTTGDVAVILEAKYNVFSTFHHLHERDVANVLEERVQGALENVMMGHNNPPEDIFADLSPIEELFRRAIDQREFDGIIPGVPTKASLRGVSHRLKRPNAKGNAARPSFFNTGMYRQSAKMWIEK